MGKRSDFERKPRDFYPTPIEAVEPLLPHLPEGFKFAEPCAGNGALIEHLESKGVCMWASVSACVRSCFCARMHVCVRMSA